MSNRTITLTIPQLAKIVAFGQVNGLAIHNYVIATNPKFGDDFAKAYTTDFNNMSDDDIKSILERFYEEVEKQKP